MNSSSYDRMLSEHPELLPVVPAPPGRMAWSNSNNLGNVVDFAPDSNQRQTILKLDEWGPPEMWTISLGIDRPPADIDDQTNQFEIRANITFGCGGASQTVLVDWVNGTQLTVPMNAVTVTAEYIYQNSNNITTVCQDLRLSVMIARGTRAAVHSPSVNLHFIDMVTWAASAQTYYLPPFTREIEIIRLYSSVNPFATSTADTEIELGDGYVDDVSQTNIINRVISVSSITADQQKFTVPWGCRTITLYDPGGGSTDRFNCNCLIGV